jgi:hypothetical protein
MQKEVGFGNRRLPALVYSDLPDSCPESYAYGGAGNIMGSDGVLDSGQAVRFSESKTITSTKFWLKKVGSVSGNVCSKIYNAAGAVGVTAKGSGAAIATSSTVTASSISTSFTLVEFTFTDCTLSAGAYVFTVNYEGAVDLENHILTDFSEPVPPTDRHYGNYATRTSSLWLSYQYRDAIFYIYGS